MYMDKQVWANTVQTQKAASDQGLYFLPLIQQFLDISAGSLFKF